MGRMARIAATACQPVPIAQSTYFSRIRPVFKSMRNPREKLVNTDQVCQRNVITVEARASLCDAARLMREHHIGYLIVVKPGPKEGTQVPVGVLTDRDIVVEAVARGVDPATLYVADIMRRNPAVVLREDSLTDVLAQMQRLGVRRMPVTWAYGQLFGIISIDDVLARLADQIGSIAGAIRRGRTLEAAAFGLRSLVHQ